MDPDAEVRAAVADVFAAFRAGGSAFQVVVAFKDRLFPKRAFGGLWDGQLRRGPLTHSRVVKILENPIYAGAYAYGRAQSRRVVEADGTVRTKIAHLPREKWAVVIHDHHEAYLSWDDYLANQARLAANVTKAGARPPREGHALCQGVIYCGPCGHRMATHYRDDGFAYYECSSKANLLSTPACRSITAETVDNVVAGRLLAALNPHEVALALAAADEVADRSHRRSRAAELAVERARYEAARAERAFHACEPENRLVARNLESRWEACLVALAEAEKALAKTCSATLPLPSRAELEALTGDVARLWDAHSTSPRDRKRLLRTLVADVTLLPEPDVGKARIGIRWHTGATDDIVVARYQKVKQWGHTDVAAVEMVRTLAHLSNREIAERLDQAGHTTGAGRRFHCREVANLRTYHNIPSAASLHDGTLPASQVAKRLGVCQHTVINWMNKGWLAGHRGLDNRWHVPFGEEVEAACRERIARSTQIHRPDDSEQKKSYEHTPREIATELGVSIDVVYYWVKHQRIEARRGPDGGWLVNFDATTEAECRQRVATSSQLKVKATDNKSKTSQSTIKEAV